MDYIEILNSKEKFPCKLSKKEAQKLLEVFEKDEKFEDSHSDKTDIEFKYFKDVNENRYVLIEEYMFKDNETFFDLTKAIGINYYLYKKCV